MLTEIIQIPSQLGNIDKNLINMKEEIKRSSSDLLIFPEIFLSGYNIGELFYDVALDLNEDPINELRDLCRGNDKGILFGLVRKDPVIGGVLYNSALYIGPDGKMAVYDKWHLANFGPFEEARYFRSGDHIMIFEIGGLKFGVVICFDIFFPELSKQYGIHGCHGIICISASPSYTKRFFETVLPARAIENTTYAIYSNVLGEQNNLVFWGGGQCWGPKGELKKRGEYYKEDHIIFEIDPHEVNITRRLRPTLRDTKRGILVPTNIPVRKPE